MQEILRNTSIVIALVIAGLTFWLKFDASGGSHRKKGFDRKKRDLSKFVSPSY